MRLRRLLWCNAILSLLPVALPASATVEGRVELPKSHSAPVQAKRYEIVTKGGVLSTQPPLAMFDLGRYRPDERPVPSQVFDKPGLVTLRCDIRTHAGIDSRFEYSVFCDDRH